MGNSNGEIGKLGEYICACHLMRLGERVEIVRLDTVDIIVNKFSKGLLRLQVKSSNYKKREENRMMSYQFFTTYGKSKSPLTKEQCDVIAFVAIDTEKAMFVSVENLASKLSQRFYKKDFLAEDLEEKTWAKVLEGVH